MTQQPNSSSPSPSGSPDTANSKALSGPALPAAGRRWLAHLVDQSLRDAWRSAEDFLRFFPAEILMARLKAAPELRVALLRRATGMHERILRRKSPALAAQDLRLALEVGILRADHVLEIVSSQERARFLEPERLWDFLVEVPFWQVDGDASPETRRAAQGLVTFALEQAVKERILSPRGLLDAFTHEALADSLPAAELRRFVRFALSRGREGLVLSERAVFDALPLDRIVQFIPLSQIWQQVVVEQIAIPCGITDASREERSGRSSVLEEAIAVPIASPPPPPSLRRVPPPMPALTLPSPSVAALNLPPPPPPPSFALELPPPPMTARSGARSLSSSLPPPPLSSLANPLPPAAPLPSSLPPPPRLPQVWASMEPPPSVADELPPHRLEMATQEFEEVTVWQHPVEPDEPSSPMPAQMMLAPSSLPLEPQSGAAPSVAFPAAALAPDAEQGERLRVVDHLASIARLPSTHERLETSVLKSIQAMYALLPAATDDIQRKSVIRQAFVSEAQLRSGLLGLIALMDSSVDTSDPVIRGAKIEPLIKILLFEEQRRKETEPFGIAPFVAPGSGRGSTGVSGMAPRGSAAPPSDPGYGVGAAYPSNDGYGRSASGVQMTASPTLASPTSATWQRRRPTPPPFPPFPGQ